MTFKQSIYEKGNSDRLPELLNATLDGELREPALQNDTPDTVPAHEIGNIVQKTNVTAARLLPTNGVGEQFVPPSRTSKKIFSICIFKYKSTFFFFF